MLLARHAASRLLKDHTTRYLAQNAAQRAYNKHSEFTHQTYVVHMGQKHSSQATDAKTPKTPVDSTNGPAKSSTNADMSDLYAVADFCLVPIGTGETSVAEQVAECQRVLEKSGLTYKLHGYGTNLEGPWSQVTKAIHDCHAAVHASGSLRIATDIRIGTRIDRDLEPGKGNEHKVTRVQEILARDQKP